MQALDDASLACLGREHSAGEALAAVELAGSPVRALLVRPDLCPPRPDAGGLGGRAGPGAGLRRRPSLALPAHHRARDAVLTACSSRPADPARRRAQARLFELTQDILGEAGLAAYEISNHARPGEACRHNLVYWRSGDWLGLGPGAHGRLSLAGQRFATEAVRLPEAWLRQVETRGNGEKPRQSCPARIG